MLTVLVNLIFILEFGYKSKQSSGLHLSAGKFPIIYSQTVSLNYSENSIGIILSISFPFFCVIGVCLFFYYFHV